MESNDTISFTITGKKVAIFICLVIILGGIGFGVWKYYPNLLSAQKANQTANKTSAPATKYETKDSKTYPADITFDDLTGDWLSLQAEKTNPNAYKAPFLDIKKATVGSDDKNLYIALQFAGNLPTDASQWPTYTGDKLAEVYYAMLFDSDNNKQTGMWRVPMEGVDSAIAIYYAPNMYKPDAFIETGPVSKTASFKNKERSELFVGGGGKDYMVWSIPLEKLGMKPGQLISANVVAQLKSEKYATGASGDILSYDDIKWKLGDKVAYQEPTKKVALKSGTIAYINKSVTNKINNLNKSLAKNSSGTATKKPSTSPPSSPSSSGTGDQTKYDGDELAENPGVSQQGTPAPEYYGDDSPEPAIKHLGLDFGAWDPANPQTRVGGFMYPEDPNSAPYKEYFEFGTVGGDPGKLMSQEYHVAPDAKVYAVIDGYVTPVGPHPGAGDYAFGLIPTKTSAWSVGYDHVLNVRVKEGDYVKAGTLLGTVGNWYDGYGRTEIGITRRTGHAVITNYCLMAFVDPASKPTLEAQLRAFMAGWEAYKKAPGLYNPDSRYGVGCNVPKIEERSACQVQEGCDYTPGNTIVY